jgi:hypothetical protein
MHAMLRCATPLAILAAALAGCAAAPAVSPTAAPLPMVTSSGLVIGTLSYQYVDTGARDGAPAWVVHFERIDVPARQDYALVVNVDPASHSGFFSGPLPAGVYAFREAATHDRRYAPGALKMPFEVQAGAVHDAGHYAVNPLAQ